MEWQKANGLQPDGIYGPGTRNKMLNKKVDMVHSGKSKYYERNGLKIIETDPDNIYIGLMKGKNLRQLGVYGINGPVFYTGNPAPASSCWQIAVNGGKPVGPNAQTNSPKRYSRATMIFYEDGRVTVERINSIGEIKRPCIWSIGVSILRS